MPGHVNSYLVLQWSCRESNVEEWLWSLSCGEHKIKARNNLWIQTRISCPARHWALSWGNNLAFPSPQETLCHNRACLPSVDSSGFYPIRHMAKCLHVAKSTVMTLSTSYSVYNLLSTRLTTASFPSWFLHHHTLSTSLLVFLLSCISFLCSLPLLHWSLNTGDAQGPELALLSLYPLPSWYHSFPQF